MAGLTDLNTPGTNQNDPAKQGISPPPAFAGVNSGAGVNRGVYVFFRRGTANNYL